MTHHLQATKVQLLTFLEEAEDTEAALSVYIELQRIQGEIERIKALIWVLVYLLPVALLVLGPPLAALVWLVRRRRKARE